VAAQIALVRENPRRGFWLVLVTLLAHPLIDAFTVYGTQIFWPLPVPSAMWSTLFIIDPTFALILIVGCVLGFWWGDSLRAGRAVAWALGLALGYLVWSGVAKWRIESIARESLIASRLQNAPRVSVPMPFTTLLWRVVVMTPDGYLEGERSLIADRGPMVFRAYSSDAQAMAAVADYRSTRTLAWFTHGFLKAQVRDGRVELTDLRMGSEPDYTFRFAVAEKNGDGWVAIPTEQLKWPWDASRRLPEVWRRIWSSESATVRGNPSPPQPSP
jgi:inner membrane protein